MPKITLIGNEISILAEAQGADVITPTQAEWHHLGEPAALDLFHTLCARLRGRAYRVIFDSVHSEQSGTKQ